MRLAVVLVALMLTLSGCAHFIDGPLTGKRYWNSTYTGMEIDWGFYDEVRQVYVRAHPDLDGGTKTAILNRELLLGMTAEQAKISWALYGVREPRINRSIGPWGVHEQWVRGRAFLYFENDILHSVQQ